MDAMFPEVDSLPGAKRQFAMDDWDAEINRCERSSNVRRHIIVAFGGVLEESIAIRNEAFEETFEIAPHLGIGVLLNEQRSGGVLEMQRGETLSNAGFRNNGVYFVGNLVEGASLG